MIHTSLRRLIDEGTDLELDDAGVPRSPVIVVDLDGPDGIDSPAVDHDLVARRLSRHRAVLIGRTVDAGRLPEPVLRGLDLTLSDRPVEHPFAVSTAHEFGASPADDLERIGDLARRRPRSCLVAAEVLRSPTGSIRNDLDTESRAYSLLQAGPEFRDWQSEPRAAHRENDRPPVVITRAGVRLQIALDRPEAHNAMDAELRFALYDALVVAAVEPALQIDLRSTGRHFSTGGDLTEFGTFPDPVTAHALRRDRSIPELAHSFRNRLTALVTGACVGSGLETAAFAGHVIADRRAFFSLPELGIGLIPGAGGTVSIPARAGRWRTLYLLLTGRRINASTARSWGLVDEVVHELPGAG